MAGRRRAQAENTIPGQQACHGVSPFPGDRPAAWLSFLGHSAGNSPLVFKLLHNRFALHWWGAGSVFARKFQSVGSSVCSGAAAQRGQWHRCGCACGSGLRRTIGGVVERGRCHRAAGRAPVAGLDPGAIGRTTRCRGDVGVDCQPRRRARTGARHTDPVHPLDGARAAAPGPRRPLGPGRIGHARVAAGPRRRIRHVAPALCGPAAAHGDERGRLAQPRTRAARRGFARTGPAGGAGRCDGPDAGRA